MKATSALNSAKSDSILETLQQHLRWSNAHVSFLKRMRAKAQEGSITAADEEAYQRRERKARGRQEGIEYFVAAHPDELWAKAYPSAVKADSTPGAPQLA